MGESGGYGARMAAAPFLNKRNRWPRHSINLAEQFCHFVDPETDLRCPKRLRCAGEWGCSKHIHLAPAHLLGPALAIPHPRRESREEQTGRGEKEASPRSPRDAAARREFTRAGRGQEAAHPASLARASRRRVRRVRRRRRWRQLRRRSRLLCRRGHRLPCWRLRLRRLPRNRPLPDRRGRPRARRAPPPGLICLHQRLLCRRRRRPAAAFSQDTRHGTGAHWH